ncbi:MAG TPA: prepilin-type N-terminal cleavage/methylation domain-containing protein [Nitrospirae bacterium]|nr:prepilin-type N-terminal cleavage/methylation domain-containing protein [Nitrospirota bacterium]
MPSLSSVGLKESCNRRPFLIDGFSLIEVMIAMVILLVGLLAFLSLQITAIRVNENNRKFLIAQDTSSREIEAAKALGYRGIKTSTNLINNMAYKAAFGTLDAKYQLTGIDQTCSSPFNYCIYKGITVTKKVGSQYSDYNYTVKLSVDTDYLSYPVLERCEMAIYWEAGGRLKTTSIVFFVEEKP